MSLFIASLNSGSNGNCYYVGNEDTAILIDAGISCREIEKRMKRLNLSINKVKALFVSHEHSDHIKGIPMLAKKHQLPVYISPDTLHHARLEIESTLLNSFRGNQTISIDGLAVSCFNKKHDAADPYSFTVEYAGTRIGIFTDIGAHCDELKVHFSSCHAAFLEANYDEEMLDKSSYPYPLKQRIRGGLGHLSNRQALELFQQFRAPFLSHLLLAHLSKNNNDPELVRKTFEPHANNTKIIIASRYEETPVYQVWASESKAGALNARNSVQGMLF